MSLDCRVNTVKEWDWEDARHQCLRVARRRLPPDAAEEVVQETLARGWTARHRHEGPDPLPWLVAITKNECSRYWRRSSRRPTHVALQQVDVHPQALDWDQVVERVVVDQVLDALPSEERRLIHLRYGLGLSQREIAETMRLPEGTVKARLHRLRVKLRLRLRSTAGDATRST